MFCLEVDVEDLEKVCGSLGEVVGRGVFERVRFKAVGASDAAGSAVAGGEDVDVGVADHGGFSGKDRVACDLAGFRDERLEAVGVWFFCVKAVAAVVLEEET